MSTTYPDGTIILQLVFTCRQPSSIKFINVFSRGGLVPFPFIYTNNLSVANADTSITQEVRRVGKYHVKLEIELGQQFKCIAMKQVEVVFRRFIVGINHRNYNSLLTSSKKEAISVKLYIYGISSYASLKDPTPSHPFPSVIHTNL